MITLQLSEADQAAILGGGMEAAERVLTRLTAGADIPENTHVMMFDAATPDEQQPLLMMVKRGDRCSKVGGRKMWGINTFKNAGQSFVLDDMLNPQSKVQLLAVTGHAGTGKTFIALLGSMQRQGVENIIFTREVQECGKSLGFLPGGIDEKFSPYMRPLYDNLEEIEFYSQRKLDNRIKSVPMQFLRGSTVRDTIIIVDEAQNCAVEQLKMVISRCGSGSMVILLGSFNQIDTHGMTRDNNGLARVIGAFKGQELFGHVHLINDERSKLARLADELL